MKPLAPEELAAIREQMYWPDGSERDEWEAIEDVKEHRRALLAHIDAITEAVEGLTTHEAHAYEPGVEWYCVEVEPGSTFSHDCGVEGAHYRLIDRDEVLALLRGTP